MRSSMASTRTPAKPWATNSVMAGCKMFSRVFSGLFLRRRLEGMQVPLPGIERSGGSAKTIEWLVQVVFRVVAPLAVGLPELQEGIADQVTVAVVHIA